MTDIKEIYKAYQKDVFFYLVSLTHDSALSEDLLSETFLSAIKSLPDFRGQSDIKTWLFSIARHKWYEHLRKKKDNICFDLLTEMYFSAQADPLEQLISKNTSNRILSVLKGQDERVRTVVMMRIEGYSYYEISVKLGISESSARIIDFRAKKKIREILRKEGLLCE